ncbi:hypothetical protein Q5P01_000860 [Channa striata]|uniref:B-cell receptor CD22 n=1 Tax=Channa striata TaxID=64152 RepID=A0AA88IJK5_CHASR|nr:hypothetical protein Q5P01_000860 [Channa striata]
MTAGICFHSAGKVIETYSIFFSNCKWNLFNVFFLRAVLQYDSEVPGLRGAAMSLTPAASGFVILLLVVPVVQTQYVWLVTYTSTNICAVKGSTVTINCSYTHPSTTNPVIEVQKTLWFVKASNNVYVDLRTDPDYSGRVDYRCENHQCSLTIRDLRLSDSAVYKFRFITNLEHGRYTGQPGVTVSVTALRVQLSRSLHNSVRLSCQSSCPLPDHPKYTWYKNGQIHAHTQNYYTNDIWTTTPADSYSCALTGHDNTRSASVVVHDLWDVTYTSTQICAFTGSTVNISCTYRYPASIDGTATVVRQTLWFTKNEGDTYTDLKTEKDYRDRVHYHCKENDCTLTISKLKESDSAVYKFRFITKHQTGKYTGRPGVSLSVTDPQLQVHVRRSTVNQFSTWIELMCGTNCPVPDHPKYIWYKNEQAVEGEEYFHLDTFNTADTYACSIKGFEEFRSPSVYAPKVPSVSVSPSAEIVEGSSVTLTCSSDSNPAANYTWYKKNQTEINKEPQLVFRSIQSSDSGQYYCTAENELGRRTSEDFTIGVMYPPKVPSVSVSPSAEIVEGSSVTLTCSSDSNPAANYTWYKDNEDSPKASGQIFTITDFRPEHSGNYYCEAQNTIGRQRSKSYFISQPDSDYTGRVTYLCADKVCNLRITELRRNDSAVYKFKFVTNQETGKFTGEPGVTLSVTALSVQVIKAASYPHYNWVDLKCHSSCDRPTYVWFKNGQKIQRQTSSDISVYVHGADSFSCAVIGHEKFPSPSVYPPKVPSVSVSPSAQIVEGSSVNLSCSSDSNPAANYTWYKKNQTEINQEPQLVFSSIQSSDSGQYYCTVENELGRRRSEDVFINVEYPPKVPSVSVSPSAEIVEGSSVTLTCSSDSNPAANYTWYKKNEDSPKASGQIFTITDFRPEHSGNYYCEAQNTIGRQKSKSYFIGQPDPPKVPSVSVSPSAQIVEGSSVNLSCSSDSNPAANYTWYKKNQTEINQEPQLVFSSIQSSDSGQYYCTVENELGRRRSEDVFINVEYPPKVPSVSVSPSAEIVEGRSVTLTCSSDSNPAANYTWYKENEDSPKASGQIFTITDFRPEHSGNYYCEAQNTMGTSEV